MSINAPSHLDSLHNAIMHPTGAIVGMVDEVLQLCRQHSLELNWRDGKCRITPIGSNREDVLDLPLQRSIFRVILARIAKLCGDNAPGTFNPYGGHGELIVGSEPAILFRVEWSNTLADQHLIMTPIAPKNGQPAKNSTEVGTVPADVPSAQSTVIAGK
jgi:hypothetical protein